MKSAFLPLCVVLFSILSPSLSAKDAGFPKGKPMISIAVPEGWASKFRDGNLYVSTENDEVIVEVSALKSSKQEGAKALEEMKDSVKSAFRKVEFKPMQEGGSNNVGLYILNGTGEDDDGKVFINAIMVTNGDNDKLFMVFVASDVEASKTFGADIAEILGSIKKVD